MKIVGAKPTHEFIIYVNAFMNLKLHSQTEKCVIIYCIKCTL